MVSTRFFREVSPISMYDTGVAPSTFDAYSSFSPAQPQQNYIITFWRSTECSASPSKVVGVRGAVDRRSSHPRSRSTLCMAVTSGTEQRSNDVNTGERLLYHQGIVPEVFRCAAVHSVDYMRRSVLSQQGRTFREQGNSTRHPLCCGRIERELLLYTCRRLRSPLVLHKRRRRIGWVAKDRRYRSKNWDEGKTALFELLRPSHVVIM